MMMISKYLFYKPFVSIYRDCLFLKEAVVRKLREVTLKNEWNLCAWPWTMIWEFLRDNLNDLNGSVSFPSTMREKGSGLGLSVIKFSIILHILTVPIRWKVLSLPCLDHHPTLACMLARYFSAFYTLFGMTPVCWMWYNSLCNKCSF